MTKTESDLQSFNTFVNLRLANEPSPPPTLPELFEQWRTERPEDAEFWDTVAAIRRAEADLDKPECWRLASETSAELRRELGLDDE